MGFTKHTPPRRGSDAFGPGALPRRAVPTPPAPWRRPLAALVLAGSIGAIGISAAPATAAAAPTHDTAATQSGQASHAGDSGDQAAPAPQPERGNAEQAPSPQPEASQPEAPTTPPETPQPEPEASQPEETTTPPETPQPEPEASQPEETTVEQPAAPATEKKPKRAKPASNSTTSSTPRRAASSSTSSSSNYSSTSSSSSNATTSTSSSSATTTAQTASITVVDGAAAPLAPGTYSLSAAFGATGSWSNYHTGQDFSAATGTPVYAVVSGTVVSGNVGSWAGNYVAIQAADGSSTLYAHLDSTTVNVGDTVTAGQQIGTVGNTGRSFGSHLHFEYYPAGVTPGDVYSATDPMAYLNALGITM